MKKTLLAALLLTSGLFVVASRGWTAPVTTPVSSPSNALQDSSSAPSVTIRIGDAAPLFRLPDGQGHLYDSRQQLGQRSITLLLVGPRVAPAKVQPLAWSSYQEVLRALSRVASQRAEDNLTLAVVFSQRQEFRSIAQDVGVLPNATPLLDEMKTLQSAVGGSDDELTLVQIDRAGWVRNIETVNDFASLQRQLLPLVDSTPTVEVGKPAPDFSVQDMRGRWHRLADLRGRKNVLLTFFPKCFTGNCANHLSSIRDVQSQFDASNTEILAVSVDPASGPHGQIAFARKLELKFPIVPDINRNLSLLYHTAYSPEQLAARMSFLIDKEGIVRWIDRQINVKTHGADALAKMRMLGMTSTVTAEPLSK